MDISEKAELTSSIHPWKYLNDSAILKDFKKREYRFKIMKSLKKMKKKEEEEEHKNKIEIQSAIQLISGRT